MRSSAVNERNTKFVVHYLHASMTPNSIPASVPIAGLFRGVVDARQHATTVATSHPHFAGWCEAFEVEDADGALVSRWAKADDC